MFKSEKDTLEAIATLLKEEKRLRREAEKKQREAKHRADALEQNVDDLQVQLSSKIDELSTLMQQLVQFMMGNEAVSLSTSMKDYVIAGVRQEFERREAKLREDYEREIAALRDEIASLKGNNNHDSSSSSYGSECGPSLETHLKSSEQQQANLAVTAHGQHTESSDGAQLINATIPQN